MPPSDYLRAGGRAEPTGADPAVAAVERPTPAGVNAPAFGSDVVADTLRVLDIPYIALTPGASYRGLHDSLVNYLGNRDAADAALPARGERRRDRARLRQGHRQGDGRRRPRQCRPDARHHGDVQRLVRPHADAGSRRDRSGRCGEAAAVDRLDPHRARPGRADPRLHQMGRPAGLARRRARGSAARRLDRQHGAAWARSTSISTPACRRRSSPSSCRRSMPPRYMPAVATAAPADLVRAGGGDAAIGQAGRDPRRARLRAARKPGTPASHSPRR